ncbi:MULTISPECIES: helix-turn-helix domain-containing protein [unclassified Paraburkholderia]|uniref:helix-turn-helix domain-containing protein n=1 Tax=unclassified Paraburkholderia TaxID=2615204 RepID=UPI00161D2E73|nr:MULTISPECIES: helix-turn-helix transcriptional regulator [unclassified Paraburkholderia]MBB5443269.1 transcriptional regulator with XRE-family HTH domain [Paraburkholderia sp. WSM4177]MBB5483125.1 transcriptional regulator with XRE-family HTH domain [Paraburkholderia sp. WSM4180]
MKTLKTLAERLAWARKRKKYSQQKLADLAGVSQAAIGNLESGIRFASLKMPVIASLLDVDALWLAEGKGTPPAELTGDTPVDTSSHASTRENHSSTNQSDATERVLRTLVGRSEKEISEIADALEALLRAGKRKPEAHPKRISITVGEPTKGIARDTDGVMFSVGKPRTAKRRKNS